MSIGLERDRDLLRPLCSGLMELSLRRVLRSALSSEWVDSDETDLRPLLPSDSPPRSEAWPLSIRLGERDRLVEIVEIESESDTEDADRDRRPESLRRFSSFSASILSAKPFLLRSKSLGTSSVSFGFSEGFRSCCVREGRGL